MLDGATPELIQPPREKNRGITLLHQGADGVENPLFVGELAALQLGIDQFAIDGQLEAAAAGRDQFQVPDLLFVGRQQLARQTEGLRLVVSHRAEFQLHVHCLSFRWGIGVETLLY
jgi:hypothetical protein